MIYEWYVVNECRMNNTNIQMLIVEKLQLNDSRLKVQELIDFLS